jgi:hypothetical protein
MVEIAPSYLLKMDRAEEHLDVLGGEVRAFSESHPYAVRKRVEDKKDVWRLCFTATPNPRIGIIGADFLYNVRSGLDHLAAALVPAANRRSVMFPIFWHGVWEDPVEGESEEKRKARQRWNTVTREMKPGAIAVLKELQPYLGYTDRDPRAHLLSSLNRLSNKDRHSGLPVMAVGLGGSTMAWTMPDGSVGSSKDPEDGGLANDAKLHLPESAMDVQIKGTMVIAVRVAMPDGYITIPHHFQGILNFARSGVVDRLIPFIHLQR